ncbi:MULTISPECIES: aldo/keto reductase [unclassified Rothia (in: high G+C Gram-positive bacteria)]|uniref:aldo/keto reductase n=1 Tax=unclassified Rothia (in: high G+C Gram-positive bacteria) TaxID=2689056 RepID=UPI00195D32F4|nr:MULTISPECIES: aldo/keto reductase [unclassified Rothia (in: high G+C Gram-positive bacteria)]MBM7052311.1 aldo/keto reductase [Rothia sp. ZJ1223]QRZ61493.1 aldo/keto reductase [Rothia sp. ZJ932]
MEYRQLGTSGLIVSSVGLGCNNLGRAGTATETQEATNTVIAAAVDAGITLFDVADIYGAEPGVSETMFGQALKTLDSSVRDDIVLVTKFGMDMKGTNGADYGVRGSRRYIMRAVEASLTRLGTDHIDLYFHHTPDEKTPIEETLVALDTLIEQGKVRYIGNSNYAGWQIAHAQYIARELGTHRYIAVENHYNLLDRRAELEVMPAARAFGLGMLPYFPLANGLLTGKYTKDQAPADGRLTRLKPQILEGANWDQLEAFSSFARTRNLSEVEIAFAWLAAQHPVASVIAGATSVEQVQANAATASVILSSEDLGHLDQIFPAPDKIALF